MPAAPEREDESCAATAAATAAAADTRSWSSEVVESIAWGDNMAEHTQQNNGTPLTHHSYHLSHGIRIQWGPEAESDPISSQNMTVMMFILINEKDL